MNTIMNSDKLSAPVATNEEQPGLIPLVDISEGKDAYVLVAEMPGVTKQGLEILLENNELTIVGRRAVNIPENAEALIREIKPRHFRRVFDLDPTVDTARIEARIDQGILTLTLPKTEQVKPRKISVN